MIIICCHRLLSSADWRILKPHKANQTLSFTAFILFYVFYLIVVILGRFVNQRLKKRKENEKKRMEKADKSTSGFQYSKAYEKKTDSVHRPATRSYGGVMETNNNHITNQNLDHTTLKSVLISEVIDSRFGIDNPALGKQMRL